MSQIAPFPPGWYSDPSGRHLYRWWDGAVWTDRVGDGSVEQHDPVGATPIPHAAPSQPAATWGVQPNTRSTPGWLIAVIIVGVVGIVGIVIATGVVVLAGGSKTVSEVDFNDGTGPFSTDSDDFVDLEFADGGYRVTVKDTDSPQEARSFFDPGRAAIRVETDVTVVEAPASAGAGLSCYNGSAGYLFIVGTDQHWNLVKVHDRGTGEMDVLGEGDDATPLGSTAHRLRLDCTGGGTNPTTVTGSIDGAVVATETDDHGMDQFQAAGYWIGAEEAPTVVLFDNFLITVP